MKVQVNYSYQLGNTKRSASLIIDAENQKAAKDAAIKLLAEERDWFKITSLKDLGQGDLPLAPAKK